MQCYIVRNTLLHTVFSVILPAVNFAEIDIVLNKMSLISKYTVTCDVRHVKYNSFLKAIRFTCLVLHHCNSKKFFSLEVNVQTLSFVTIFVLSFHL